MHDFLERVDSNLSYIFFHLEKVSFLLPEEHSGVRHKIQGDENLR